MKDVSRYELYKGNCFEWLNELADNSIDLVLTDPPYEHVTGGMKSKNLNNGTFAPQSVNQKMSQFKHDDVFRFLDLVIPKMKKVNMFCFCSRLQLASYFDYLNQHKKLKFDLLIWDKSSAEGRYGMKSSKFFSQDIEYIVRIYQSGVSLNKVWNDEHTHAVSQLYMKRQKFPQPHGLHESMKPVELLRQYIELATPANGVVLDPFMGSGSTGVAALKLGRRFVGIEINEKYYHIAQQRLAELG